MMDDTQVVFSQEDENIGLNVHLDREGNNSNGHGGGKEEGINLVGTIKKL
jgi:hypothetical protein